MMKDSFVNHADYIPALSKRADNYLKLVGTRFHDFFPPVELADGGLRQGFVHGLRIDDLDWFKKQLPATYFLETSLQTFQQTLRLLETYGILLSDRNPTNSFAVPVNQDSEMLFRKKGGDWSLIQIDFESATDLSLPTVSHGLIRDEMGEPGGYIPIYDSSGATLELTRFLRSFESEIVGVLDNNAVALGRATDVYRTVGSLMEMGERNVGGLFVDQGSSSDLTLNVAGLWRIARQFEEVIRQYLVNDSGDSDWGISAETLLSVERARLVVDSK